MCISGENTLMGAGGAGAGALLRGGHFLSGAYAGPFFVDVARASDWDDYYGFRCARDL
jgi:hypothetical protein